MRCKECGLIVYHPKGLTRDEQTCGKCRGVPQMQDRGSSSRYDSKIKGMRYAV